MKNFTITANCDFPQRRILKGDQLNIAEVSSFDTPGVYFVMIDGTTTLSDDIEQISKGIILGKATSIIIST